MSSAVIFQIQSVLIVILFTLGILNRKKRNLHVKLMSSAIAWDILLILQIELTRGAVGKAMKVVVNPVLLIIHVAMALTTVVLYFFMIYSGRKMLRGEVVQRKMHLFCGISCYVLRILVLGTSFYTVSG